LTLLTQILLIGNKHLLFTVNCYMFWLSYQSYHQATPLYIYIYVSGEFYITLFPFQCDSDILHFTTVYLYVLLFLVRLAVTMLCRITVPYILVKKTWTL